MTLPTLSQQKIALVRRLSKRKDREREGRFVVEGERTVAEALRALPNFRLEYIIVAKSYALGKKYAKCKVYTVADDIFRTLTDTETPQGIAAVVKFTPQLDFVSLANSLMVVCDGVQDPGNLGTIIRSADAVAAAAVFIGPGTVDPFNPKVVRASMGSLFHVPVINAGNSAELVKTLKRENVKIVIADHKAQRNFWQADLKGKLAVVLGGEVLGVSEEYLKAADARVNIPIFGRAESLNVAMAGTVFLYEAMRQRKEVSN